MIALAVVIPCFNEKAVLPTTIERLDKLMGQLMEDVLIAPASTVTFVDDGSSDGTWSLIQEATRKKSCFME